MWIDGAPGVSNLKNLTKEQQQPIIDNFSELVTAFHPNPGQPPADIHPSRKILLDIPDLDTDLAELLNKVQRQTERSEEYCIRKNKTAHQKECRFKFPQEYSAEARIDGFNVEFVSKRNDNRLNVYNKYLIQTWRAKRALINYLAKYISKSEHKSTQLSDLMSTIN